jgi:hypothetical protein
VLLGLVLLLLFCCTHLALLVASVLCCFPAALLHCLHQGIGVPHAAAAGQQSRVLLPAVLCIKQGNLNEQTETHHCAGEHT